MRLRPKKRARRAAGGTVCRNPDANRRRRKAVCAGFHFRTRADRSLRGTPLWRASAGGGFGSHGTWVPRGVCFDYHFFDFREDCTNFVIPNILAADHDESRCLYQLFEPQQTDGAGDLSCLGGAWSPVLDGAARHSSRSRLRRRDRRGDRRLPAFRAGLLGTGVALAVGEG